MHKYAKLRQLQRPKKIDLTKSLDALINICIQKCCSNQIHLSHDVQEKSKSCLHKFENTANGFILHFKQRTKTSSAK